MRKDGISTRFAYFSLAGNKYPLTVMGLHLLDRTGCIKELSLNREILTNFLMTIEESYHDNPYHNALHATDVAISMYHWLKQVPFKNNFDLVGIFASILSAIVHDVKHPGTNNPFQISFQTELATCYNDIAVLENMHIAETWRLLRAPEFRGLLKGVGDEQQTYFRDLTVHSILATDPSVHAKHLSDLKSSLEEDRDLPTRDWDRETQLLMVGMALHTADLGNPTKPLDQCKKWAGLVHEEFNMQGDLERKAGKKISPNCDKKTVHKPTCQAGFMDYIIKPLFETWGQVLEAGDALANLAENRAYWGR
eukprot:TRINITY_DN2177_c0_g1_i2.p1 TRINITY_DN2177_c0_g1~~TRINITY_DN2177_c0_g1_i2.p1  ORF type:complete len:308 (-),score=50.58 TRINITY_DN2177_c0_g1_i2:108-1031(-)